MTVARNLERFIIQQQQFDNTSSSDNNNKFFQSLRGLPFWIWDDKKHAQIKQQRKGNCCFWDIIGPPLKKGVPQPVWDYQALLYKTLFTEDPDYSFKSHHLWVKKSTGLGVSEFFLRLIAWLCL